METITICFPKKGMFQMMNYEQERRIAAEDIWLNYFNNALYEAGLISETERNQMIVKIQLSKNESFY